MELFRKDYESESIYDIYLDVSKGVNEDFNTALAAIPADKRDCLQGTFTATITITWNPPT